MKKLIVLCFAAALTAVGCGSYNASQVPLTEPKDHSYCQRIDDMAVGLEPYMVKDKTALTFDTNLRKDEVMALNVAMLADGKMTYKVKKEDITAVDEFGKNYAPMSSDQMAMRIERAFRKDKPELYEDMKAREMPDEVTVSNSLTQGFVYFDMEPNKTDSRKFTVLIPAVSADGSVRKEFRLTVDPFLGTMNPTEKWDSYDGRGITPCGLAAKAEVPPEQANKAEESATKAEQAARRAEEAAKKSEKEFEKSLVK